MTNNKYTQGHRQRAKDSFFNNYHSNQELNDYQILEILLFYAIPRKDVKPLAKELLKHFGSLQKILNAPFEELQEFKGITKNTYILFLTIKGSFISLLKKDLKEKTVLSKWQQLLDYCYVSLAYEKIEKLQILYLNNKNYLIKDEIIQEGTINYLNIHLREIVKKVLNIGAVSFILVHNHPSGDANPSNEDIEVTLALKKVAKELDINFHDHIIVSNEKIISLKDIGIFV